MSILRDHWLFFSSTEIPTCVRVQKKHNDNIERESSWSLIISIFSASGKYGIMNSQLPVGFVFGFYIVEKSYHMSLKKECDKR